MQATSTYVTQRVVWGLTAALVCLGSYCAFQAVRFDTPFAGFLVYRSGAVSSLWRDDWPGRRAGLQVRDRVRAIDGVPVRGGRAVQAALAAAEARGQTRVTVEVESRGALRAVQLPLGRMRFSDESATFGLPFSVGVVYLLLGVLIFAV